MGWDGCSLSLGRRRRVMGGCRFRVPVMLHRGWFARGRRRRHGVNLEEGDVVVDGQGDPVSVGCNEVRTGASGWPVNGVAAMWARLDQTWHRFGQVWPGVGHGRPRRAHRLDQLGPHIPSTCAACVRPPSGSPRPDI